MISHSAPSLKALWVVFTAGSLAACASGARPGAMTAPLNASHIINQTSPFYMAVAIKSVGGGRDTNPLLQSQVSSADFTTALQQSLQLNTMLATSAPKYNLSASLDDLKQPIIGLSMTVTAKVHYVVAPSNFGPPVFDQTITTPYTAAFGDALVGVERLRLANEGAIRNNITDFIKALAEVKPAGAPSS
jgi:hypothetical protein